MQPGDFVRFWSKVDLVGQKDPIACFEWQGRLDRAGYGRFDADRRPWLAHKWLWEHVYGAPVPDGLELDHLCRNRACVRLSHLEVVTHAENVRRGIGNGSQLNAAKTECPKGHAYSGRNNRGQRICRICKNEQDRARYALQRGAA